MDKTNVPQVLNAVCFIAVAVCLTYLVKIHELTPYSLGALTLYAMKSPFFAQNPALAELAGGLSTVINNSSSITAKAEVVSTPKDDVAPKV